MSSEDEFSEEAPENVYNQAGSSGASYENVENRPNYNQQSGGMSNSARDDGGAQRQKRKYVRRKDPGERKKRGPRTKDLNAPRMPLNGYVRFLNANRERVKNDNPHLTFAEVTKKLAAQWSGMGDDDKKAYLDEANKAKEAYLKELHEYQQTEQYHKFMSMKRAKQQQMHDARSGSMISAQQMYDASRGSNPQAQYYPDNNFHSLGPQLDQAYKMNAPPGTSSQQSYHCFQQLPSQYQNSGSMGKGDASSANQQQRNNLQSSRQTGSFDDAKLMKGFQYESDSNDAGTKTPDSNNEENQGNAEAFARILARLDSDILDLPIFTEEFLDHNKLRDKDLKRVRTMKQDHEEENAILMKHVESVQQQYDKLRYNEMNNVQHNTKLKRIVETMQTKLVDCLKEIELPADYCDTNGQIELRGPPNVHNIDHFMARLERYRTNNPEADQFMSRVARAFDSLATLNLSN